MVQVAQALYLLSTLAFAVTAAVVGLRLLLLSRRTGQEAERMLGIGVLFTAVLGYALLMVGLIGRRLLGVAAGDGAMFTGATLVGWLFHNVGVMCMLRFVVVVFRPGDRWARLLAAAMSVVLWIGWGSYAADGGLVDGQPHGGYWIAFAVIGTYPLWTAVESFRYWVLMRRRLALGLADPLVANRFLLWALASLSAAASIWIVNLPSLSGRVPGSEAAADLTAVAMLFTGAFGVATVCAYWLTFFPPAWYRRRFAPAAAAEHPSIR